MRKSRKKVGIRVLFYSFVQSCVMDLAQDQLLQSAYSKDKEKYKDQAIAI